MPAVVAAEHRALTFLCALLLALTTACSGRGCADAPAQDLAGRGAPQSGVALRDRVVGVWSVGPSRAAIEKMRNDLKKAARGDEQKLAEMLKRYEESMAGTTLEFTGTTVITRQFEREIASDRYDVIEESERTLRLRLARTQQEASFTFEEDETVSTELKDLGPVALKRRP